MDKCDASALVLTEQCFIKLQRDIIEHKIKPGERLQTEHLEQIYGVNKSILFNVLTDLAATGLIEVDSIRDYRVTKYNEEEIVDLFQTFTQIELLALRLAIHNGDSDWEKNILLKLHTLSLLPTIDNSTTYSKWSECHSAFHFACIEACQSKKLLQIRANLQNLLLPIRRIVFHTEKKPLKQNYKEHVDLATAVISRQADHACQITLKNICDLEAHVLPILTEHGWIGR